jgi:hypothetical protein
MVAGKFFRPDEWDVEPYITIATGDFQDLSNQVGEDEAIKQYLLLLFHELMHYFQFTGRIDADEDWEERNADEGSDFLMRCYCGLRA